MKTKIKVSLFLLFLCLSGKIFSQDSPTKKDFAHISVVHSVNTQGSESKNYEYPFSLNLLTGVVGSVKGVEIGGLFNENKRNMTGVQVAGLLNITKNNMNGVQYAGLTNITGPVKGVQVAGLNNMAQEVSGIQSAGFANIATDVKGVQISGLYNQAKKLKGFQIGVINVVDSVEKGGTIGLINIVKRNGYREVELSASDYQNIGINYKSGTKTLYTILSAGYNFNKDKLLVAGLGVGGILAMSPKWYFKPEIIVYNYTDNPFEVKKSANAYHFRFGFMRKIDKVGITVVPSVYYAQTDKNPEGGMLAINAIKPFSSNIKDAWGIGLGIGVALLK